MRLAPAIVVVVVGLIGGCRSSATSRGRECGEPLTPSQPPHSEIRHGHVIDSAYARQDLARLVFRVRSAGPTAPGSAIAAPAVLLRDSLGDYRTQLARIGDAKGVTIVDSVPLRYRSARVQRLGYAGLSFPLGVRSGYTDTIDVTLAEARICLYH